MAEHDDISPDAQVPGSDGESPAEPGESASPVEEPGPERGSSEPSLGAQDAQEGPDESDDVSVPDDGTSASPESVPAGEEAPAQPEEAPAQSEETAPASPEPVPAETPGPKVGLIDRPRRPRPPFVPSWVPITSVVIIAVIALIVAISAYAALAGRVIAPNVTGLEVGVATARLAQQGLTLDVSQHRFSDKPADTILSQSPAPGTKVKRGDALTVVVSGGTEQFALPDVIGDGILLARGVLESKGLSLHIEIQPSSQPSDTVLSTNPSPGALVHTGDIITVSIASTGTAPGLLLPFDMKGMSVDIDPAPVAGGESDVTLDVGRRLQSLIEASGGTVVSLRSATESGTAADDSARAGRASTAGHPTVAIGLSTIQSGPGGMAVISPAAGQSQIVIPSKILASAIASELASAGQTVRASTTATDPVLGATEAPWSRVQLGSFTSQDDLAQFNDPTWADTVARSIYRAIGSLYAKKSSPS